MLTRPDITDESIIACLRDSFRLPIVQADFLPIGADVGNAAFRVTTDGGTPYFLKLRRGRFNEVAVDVPSFLNAHGVHRVMAPIATTNQWWVHAGGLNWMLYPYFDGSNGFEAALSKFQWNALGESLKSVHGTILPAELAERVPREDYTPRWRNLVKAYSQQVQRNTFADPIAANFAAFWRTTHSEIESIVERAEQLAQMLQNRAVNLSLCHADLHGGNVLVGKDDEIAIVDWDGPILAPKERDLMFVGAGIGDVWNQSQEAAWFYEGYGPVEIDSVGLAYYRYERIVADLAAYAEQIFGVQGSAEDRAEGLRQVMGQFLPGSVVEIAHKSYPGRV